MFLLLSLFQIACSDGKTDRDTGVHEDTSAVIEDTATEDTGTEDTGVADSETDDSATEEDSEEPAQEGINIFPSNGSGGAWSAGEIGRTTLGADIRIPTTYDPENLASPVVWLFNEEIDEWIHTDDDGVIIVDLQEYNDVPAILDKLNESMALLQEEYNVDQGRYYFAGWSAGGNIAVVLGAMNQSLIAGTMVFPGTGGNQAKDEMEKPQNHKIRLFYACGDEDPAYPWDGVQQEADYWHTAYGYETQFVRVEGGPHKLAESVYGIREQAWTWMRDFNMAN